MKRSSLEHKLIGIAVNCDIPATQVMFEYILQQQFLNQVLGYRYHNRQSHIKVYAYRAIESIYKYHSSSNRTVAKK